LTADSGTFRFRAQADNSQLNPRIQAKEDR
jgi:hypothetical protein